MTAEEQAKIAMKLEAEAVERACKAHWPSWDRMRLDHQRKWRKKMQAALRAAHLG